jgi:hypothetical protein
MISDDFTPSQGWTGMKQLGGKRIEGYGVDNGFAVSGHRPALHTITACELP